MAKIIIGIHGMGNKPPRETLKMWWQAPIMEGLNRINKPELSFRFELFYWTQYIHPVPLDPGIKDKKHPLYLEQPYAHAPQTTIETKPHKFREKFLDYLNRQMEKLFLNEDFTINYASINDFIIRHFFRDLEIYFNDFCIKQDKECSVKEAICSDLADILKKYRRKKIMLIAHSMGSIIAYDVLKNYVPKVPIDTFVTIGSPLGLPIIKSKIIAESEKNPSQKIELKTPENVRSNWYNLSDIRDKIAINYKLGDDFTENTRHVRPVDKIVINNYEFMGEKNPHKSYGYLRTPEMAEIISKFWGDNFYSPSVWINKIKSMFEAVGLGSSRA